LRPFDVVGDFSRRLTVLPYTPDSAYNCGGIRAELERQGRPIGVNDLHIAAHARNAGLTLVTNNIAKFGRVPGLLVENWLVGT